MPDLNANDIDHGDEASSRARARSMGLEVVEG